MRSPRSTENKRKYSFLKKLYGALLFANWLNYFVYQETPYDIDAITPQHGE